MVRIQYQGGKSRIKKAISEVILNEVSRREEQDSETYSYGNFAERERENKKECNTFISLFCGSCVVESEIAKSGRFDNIICNDNHEYLIAMWKGLQNGYELPEYITEEQYKYIKNNKNENKVLAGFVGFGCSFGGKWFGGYARDKQNVNYCLRSKNSVLKDLNNLRNAIFLCKDYKNIEYHKNDIIYADPPYKGTTGYNHKKFDTDEFWEYASEVSKTNMMFISELATPDDFICIWQKELRRTLDVNKNNNFMSTEKLFLHKRWVSSGSDNN